MYFVGLEDMTGRVELLVFGKAAERTGESWIIGEVVIVDARLSHKDGDLKCMAEGVEKISSETLSHFARAEATRTKLARPTPPEEKEETVSSEPKITISLGTVNPTQTIRILSEYLKTIPVGDQKVSVKIGTTVIETTFAINPSPDQLAELAKIDGVDSVS